MPSWSSGGATASIFVSAALFFILKEEMIVNKPVSTHDSVTRTVNRMEDAAENIRMNGWLLLGT